MRLRTWATRDVPGLLDGEWDLGGASLVLVTGTGACGKSRWLASLAAHKEMIAAYGSTGWVADLVGSALAVTTAEWQLTDAEHRFGGFPGPQTSTEVQHATSEATADPGMLALCDRYRHDLPLGRVLWIPPHRLPLRSPPSLGDERLAERLLALVPDASKLGASLSSVRRLARERPSDPVVASVNDLLAAAGTHLSLMGTNGAGELECHIGRGERVAVGRLAASEQQLILIATHFVVTKPKESVVLFDAPEEDLAPSRAAALLSAMREREPTNQWIVATSDRLIVESESDAKVIDLGAGRA